MQPHIRQWHTRYRVIGEPGNGVALVERGVRERAVTSYADAIERAFASDPAVYVLRRVHTEVTVASPAAASEADNARRWAAQIFAGVIRTVTCEGDRADLVMRFEDVGDYVTHFIVDLLDGVAWDRWYYGAFSEYRGFDAGETVRRILVDFADELPAIFRRLAAKGRLCTVLSRLSIESAGDVWQIAIRQVPKASPEAFRIFLRTARTLADKLELWTSGPSEDELLLQYFRTSPTDPDWKQTRALAEAVYAAFDFLDRTGLLVRDASGVFEQFARAGEPLVESLDWLDHEWLAAALRAHLSPKSKADEAAAIPRPLALSPLQLRVLQLLLQLLKAGGVTLPESEPDSHANALTLFAALSSAQPTLADHSATPALIEWLLARWQASSASRSETALPPAQRLGSLITLILQRDVASPPLPQPKESWWLKMPGPKIGPVALPSDPSSEGNLVESTHAGVFLLSRAVIEGRATQLASAMGLSTAVVLLALAAEWTAVDPDTLDPGVLLWTGYDPAAGPPSAQIRALDPAACEGLCAAIESMLRDRAAFAPSLASVREPDATPLAAIALHLLRLWAHWLPGFAQSSATFLLNQVIRRGGLLRVDSREIAVSLRPAALDVVLQMAGYLQPIPAIPWLADRRVTFAIDSALSQECH